MPDPLIVTEHDVKESGLLLRFLRRVAQAVLKLDSRVERVERVPPPLTTAATQRALQATGPNPLRVDNLRGVLADPQIAAVTHYASAPTGQILQNLKENQLVTVGTTSTGDTLYRVIGGNPNTLRLISPAISGSAVSVADNVFSIYDNVDNTKIAQFECSSIATGTTRVYTFPDAAMILAGRNVTNNFTANQIFNSSTGTPASQLHVVGSAGPVASLPTIGVSEPIVSENNGSCSYTQVIAAGSNGGLVIRESGAGAAVEARLLYTGSANRWDIVGGGGTVAQLTSAGALTLIGGGGINVSTGPISNVTTIGMNNLLTNTRAGQAIRIAPASSAGANTIMIEVESTGGSTLWSVDAEGDEAATSLVLNGSASNTLLVRPSSAPAANTKMAVVQTSTGGEVFSVDIEGDAVMNAITSSGLLTANLGATVNNAALTIDHEFRVTSPQVISSTASSATVAAGETVVLTSRSAGGAGTLFLPAAPGTGRTVDIVDATRNAGANNQTLDGNGLNINGLGTYVMNTNGKAVRLYYDGTEWFITAAFN